MKEMEINPSGIYQENEALDSLKNLFSLINNGDQENIPSDDAEVIKAFNDSLKKYIGSEVFDSLLGEAQAKPVDETFLRKLALTIFAVDRDYSTKLVEGTELTVGEIRKWCYTPELIERFKTANCSGSASMSTAFLKSLGVKAYIGNPVGHAVTLVNLGEDWFYVDPRNKVVEKMDIAEMAFDEKYRLNLVKLSKNISDYKMIPFFTSLQDGVYSTVKGNHETLDYEAKKGKKLAIFAKEALGERFFQEMDYPIVEETEKLRNSIDWAKEKERHDSAVYIFDSFEVFADTIGRQNAENILNIIVSDRKMFDELVNFLQKKPVVLASETSDKKEIFGIDKKIFLDAHRQFWQSLEDVHLEKTSKAIHRTLQKIVQEEGNK